MQSSQEIRKAFELKWNQQLASLSTISSDSINGSTPPSVFVGSSSYPKLNVGPMVPPVYGDTSIFDQPERWTGRSLHEIINFRLNLVRGIKNFHVDDIKNRYVENLQEMTMSTKPVASEIQFQDSVTPVVKLDEYHAPFGPVGTIKSAKFENSTSQRQIQQVYYDRDLKADDAIKILYSKGVPVTQIQKCLSIAMLGIKRKLVPTRWSITAVDDILSKSLVQQVINFSVLDEFRVFQFSHLGNLFSVILFPHRWLYEMIEAWYSKGILGFGSDHEDSRGIDHPPAIAGAYFAARLAVAEYLVKNKIQSGVLVLREIRPEYSMPVGVWQIREGVRQAMKHKFIQEDTFENALTTATKKMSIGKTEWLRHGKIMTLLKQKTLTDFFG